MRSSARRSRSRRSFAIAARGSSVPAASGRRSGSRRKGESLPNVQRLSAAPRLQHPELIHLSERVRTTRFECMPIVERVERPIRGKSRAIGGCRAGVPEFEAEKGQSELGQDRCDLRQREAMLLDVEDEVAKSARAVEI